MVLSRGTFVNKLTASSEAVKPSGLFTLRMSMKSFVERMERVLGIYGEIIV